MIVTIRHGRDTEMRTLNFRLTIDGVSDPTLVVRQFHGHESISDSPGPVCGYRYQIEVASRSSSHTADEMVDSKALLEVIKNGQIVQKVHGIIRCFSKGDTGYHHTFYAITLVPSLERLSLRQNSRIFQQKNTQDIITTLLGEMGISDFSFSLKRPPATREFCVQYRESDLAFFHRLAAEEGMMYTFSHEDSKHTLIITDNPESFPEQGAPVLYNALSGGAGDDACVRSLTEHKQAEISTLQMQDYSFKKPSYPFTQTVDGKAMDYQNQTYEYFDHPGRFKDDGNGKAFTQIRMEYLRRNAHTVTGNSDEPKIQAGQKFTLTDHLEAEMNRKWLTVFATHTGTQPQALEEDGSNGATTYHNEFTVIPGDAVWRAQIQPKPQVDGPCIATVTGPAGEEIYCDEHGRVKVQFPWDRYGSSDENSSCWVRVAQGWAGTQYGFIAIPRIGHEVIISFLNGDPDQPIITGRTYHASNLSPYPLPLNKTRTVIRTQTHQGVGFNEIRFEDQAGVEEVFMHAQKDQNNVVNNDETTQVGHDRTENVGNDEKIDIGHDRTETVGNNETITIGNDRTETVGSNEVVTIKGNQAETVVIAKAESIGAGKALSIGAGYQVSVGGAINKSVGLSDTSQIGGSKSTSVKKKIAYDAGDEIVLTTGKASLTMKSDGTITLKGVDITLSGKGEIKTKAKQNVVIKGKKVLEN
ncbi:Phage-related baseplate assembly protein [Vibrio quintilis]|uniref:Phage-related baseplate assembly protein n=2 Tax=Vibrio quintilis TaxID=1117707 RepID=A0A1M7YWI2_9VIBR|nr:Phage-related baseplate assembly protein [Vibrio quintilis]